MASVTMNQIDVPVFGRCLKMENALVELVVTLDVGPRIIRFAVPGKANMMAELPDMQWENGWKIWGGHRLWAAPESMPLTYELDNTPCEYEILENGVRLWRQKDPISGLSKEIEIGMDGETSVVDILHRIRNDNPWEIEYAAWALTVLAPGGQIEHVEVWELMPGFGLPEKDDDALEALMGPIVDSIGCDGDCDACGHDDCHSAHGCHG